LIVERFKAEMWRNCVRNLKVQREGRFFPLKIDKEGRSFPLKIAEGDVSSVRTVQNVAEIRSAWPQLFRKKNIPFRYILYRGETPCIAAKLSPRYPSRLRAAGKRSKLERVPAACRHISRKRCEHCGIISAERNVPPDEISGKKRPLRRREETSLPL